MVIKKADKMMEKLGYVKKYESDLCVQYARLNTKFNYVEQVDLYHKSSGKHYICSFEKGKFTEEGFSIMIGIDQKTAKACLKKMAEKGWKYGKSDYIPFGDPIDNWEHPVSFEEE